MRLNMVSGVQQLLRLAVSQQSVQPLAPDHITVVVLSGRLRHLAPIMVHLEMFPVESL